VFEKDDRIGGLLRYGIPDFKMEKHHIDRRVAQMEAEGTRFRLGVNIGVDITWPELRSRFDAVLVATGAPEPRDLKIPGRNLEGVEFAMHYLHQANQVVAGDDVNDQISAVGKRVIILGGGDTGADCLGTATRQGALSVTTLAIGNQPPAERQPDQPWPTFPNLFEVASAHEEFGERKYLASTVEFVANGNRVSGVRVAETEFVSGKRVPKPGTERVLEADLVLLALGFTGADQSTLATQTSASFDDRGNVVRAKDWQSDHEGLFVAGDAGRGQSLIVWAIAEGRSAAAAIDNFLEGVTELPAPVKPNDRSFDL
jgi:glutamate synthase (NADPH/NADH) small chain